jgi:8-oxo-dGTP pyrophosphatase MutT (NUDIX family)
MIDFDIYRVPKVLQPVDNAEKNIISDNGNKRAAVLLPLIWHENQWNILYTKRTETIPHHKGQISFPGGMYEPVDKNMHDTALRETEEELGISRNAIQTLGCMDDFMAVSGINISPFVGIIFWPQRLQLSVDEVSRVIIMPVSWLANPEHYEKREYQGYRDVIYYQPYEGDVLWGITAHLTRVFLEKFEE